MRDLLAARCEALGIRGTLLVADEGINGTIAGSPAAIEAIVGVIRVVPGCDDLDVKYSAAAEMPFLRMKVRLKREIVTMGQPGIDPLASVGDLRRARGLERLDRGPGYGGDRHPQRL